MNEGLLEEVFNGRITGITDRSLIIRVGNKRLVLETTEDIAQAIENSIPCSKKLTIRGHKIVKYDDYSE